MTTHNSNEHDAPRPLGRFEERWRSNPLAISLLSLFIFLAVFHISVVLLNGGAAALDGDGGYWVDVSDRGDPHDHALRLEPGLTCIWWAQVIVFAGACATLPVLVVSIAGTLVVSAVRGKTIVPDGSWTHFLLLAVMLLLWFGGCLFSAWARVVGFALVELPPESERLLWPRGALQLFF